MTYGSFKVHPVRIQSRRRTSKRVRGQSLTWFGAPTNADCLATYVRLPKILAFSPHSHYRHLRTTINLSNPVTRFCNPRFCNPESVTNDEENITLLAGHFAGWTMMATFDYYHRHNNEGSSEIICTKCFNRRGTGCSVRADRGCACLSEKVESAAGCAVRGGRPVR
jgi:hypothetical protein